MPRPAAVAPLLLALALVAPSARAADVSSDQIDVTFHISHPAKEYDVHLLPGGATATVHLDPEQLSSTTLDFTLKVDHLNSDNRRRDSHMIEVLEGLIFETIDWTVTSVAGIAGPVAPGTFEGSATGPLTVHGVTRPITVPITATIDAAGKIAVASSFEILLEDYQIERPALLFVPIENVLPIRVGVTFAGGPSIFPVAEPTPTPGPEQTPDAAGSGEPAQQAPTQDASK